MKAQDGTSGYLYEGNVCAQHTPPRRLSALHHVHVYCLPASLWPAPRFGRPLAVQAHPFDPERAAKRRLRERPSPLQRTRFAQRGERVLGAMRPAKICNDSRATTSSSRVWNLPRSVRHASCRLVLLLHTPQSAAGRLGGESGIGWGHFGQRSVSLAQITSARPSISLPVVRSGLGDGFLGPLALRFVREDATPGRSTEMQFRPPEGDVNQTSGPLGVASKWLSKAPAGTLACHATVVIYSRPVQSTVVTHGLFRSTAHRR